MAAFPDDTLHFLEWHDAPQRNENNIPQILTLAVEVPSAYGLPAINQVVGCIHLQRVLPPITSAPNHGSGVKGGVATRTVKFADLFQGNMQTFKVTSSLVRFNAIKNRMVSSKDKQKTLVYAFANQGGPWCLSDLVDVGVNTNSKVGLFLDHDFYKDEARYNKRTYKELPLVLYKGGEVKLGQTHNPSVNKPDDDVDLDVQGININAGSGLSPHEGLHIFNEIMDEAFSYESEDEDAFGTSRQMHLVGKVTGAAAAGTFQPNRCYLANFTIRSGLRGLKLGDELLQAAHNRAKQLGFTEILLYVAFGLKKLTKWYIYTVYGARLCDLRKRSSVAAPGKRCHADAVPD